VNNSQLESRTASQFPIPLACYTLTRGDAHNLKPCPLDKSNSHIPKHQASSAQTRTRLNLALGYTKHKSMISKAKYQTWSLQRARLRRVAQSGTKQLSVEAIRQRRRAYSFGGRQTHRANRSRSLDMQQWTAIYGTALAQSTLLYGTRTTSTTRNQPSHPLIYVTYVILYDVFTQNMEHNLPIHGPRLQLR
jgi:hypothetical protein